MRIRDRITTCQNVAELQQLIDLLVDKHGWNVDYFLSFSEQAKKFREASKERLTFEFAEAKRLSFRD